MKKKSTNKDLKRADKESKSKFKKEEAKKRGSSHKERKGSKKVELIGRVNLSSQGYGFLIVESDKKVDDLFISRKNLNDALEGDRVSAEIIEGSFQGKKKLEARVVDILERSITSFVGIVDIYKSLAYVYPFSRKLKTPFILRDSCGVEIESDDILLCDIEYGQSSNKLSTCKLVKKLGAMGDIGIDNEIVLHKYGLSRDYPSDATKLAEKLEDKKYGCEEDFRNLFTFTIDGETARDFDDAISIERSGSDFILYVHIADVSRYVLQDSLIDRQALIRGTSTYFPEFAINMLPSRLSDDLCSLVEGKDRFTLSCKMVFDKAGCKKDVEFYRSIINSNFRLTYSLVNKIFLKQEKPLDKSLLANLEACFELANIMLEKRKREGVIDFELPEVNISFNDDGSIKDILPKERGFAERLIECFMIAANESVAEHFARHKIPAMFRVHDKPDIRKLEEWCEVASSLGVHVGAISAPSEASEIAAIVRKVSTSKYSDILTTLLIRSMAKAEYSAENIGHFGLASKAYTHFTSPIRRYPDLLVHRVLLKSLNLSFDDNFISSDFKRTNKDLAAHLSDRERFSVDAEHDILAFKKMQFISLHFEDIFEGYINKITHDGFFCYVEKLMLTGYIDFESIEFDTFKKSGNAIISRRKKLTYKLGDKVEITPYRINILTLQADFTLKHRGKKNKYKDF